MIRIQEAKHVAERWMYFTIKNRTRTFFFIFENNNCGAFKIQLHNRYIFVYRIGMSTVRGGFRGAQGGGGGQAPHFS